MKPKKSPPSYDDLILHIEELIAAIDSKDAHRITLSAGLASVAVLSARIFSPPKIGE